MADSTLPHVVIEKITMGLETDELIILRDYTGLAQILLKQGQFGNALIYGRKALKGYRRLDTRYIKKMHEVLELLIQISYHSEDEREMEAYVVLLENSRAQHGDGLGTSSEALVKQSPQTSRRPNSLGQEQLTTASSPIESSSKELNRATTQVPSSSDSAVSFFPDVKESRSIVLVGYRGCGKTTFIK